MTQQRWVTVLLNAETGKSIVAGPAIPEDNNRNQPPSLAFTCGGESGCALMNQVWMADGRAWTFHAPHLKSYEEARVEVVYLGAHNGE